MTRGSGRTTASMQAAPLAAIYIAPCARSVEYTRRLAYHLDRPDLRVESPGWLANDRILGLRLPLVFDHAIFEFGHLGEIPREAFAMANHHEGRMRHLYPAPKEPVTGPECMGAYRVLMGPWTPANCHKAAAELMASLLRAHGWTVATEDALPMVEAPGLGRAAGVIGYRIPQDPETP